MRRRNSSSHLLGSSMTVMSFFVMVQSDIAYQFIMMYACFIRIIFLHLCFIFLQSNKTSKENKDKELKTYFYVKGKLDL
jgi:hypothetical protein